MVVTIVLVYLSVFTTVVLMVEMLLVYEPVVCLSCVVCVVLLFVEVVLVSK